MDTDETMFVCKIKINVSPKRSTREPKKRKKKISIAIGKCFFFIKKNVYKSFVLLIFTHHIDARVSGSYSKILFIKKKVFLCIISKVNTVYGSNF